MTPVDAAVYAQVATAVFPHARLRHARPLAGGISAQMVALDVALPDGRSRRLVVRQAPAAAAEYRLLRQLQPLPVAAPVPLALDHSGALLPTPYLVLDYVTGAMDFAPADPAACARQMAAQLAAIHRAGAALDLAYLPHAAPPCAELAAPPPIPTADLDPAPIRAALAAAPRRPNPPTLLHGDFWPGNVLWHNGRLAAIIDWEDAARGDPLIDLARSRSEIAWILGPAALDAFTRHYLALAPIHTADLPYWDLCAALRLLRLANGDLAGLAAYFAAYGRADITAATIRRHVHAFIAAARARLPAG